MNDDGPHFYVYTAEFEHGVYLNDRCGGVSRTPEGAQRICEQCQEIWPGTNPVVFMRDETTFRLRFPTTPFDTVLRGRTGLPPFTRWRTAGRSMMENT